MQILNLILSVLAVLLAGAALITVTGEKRRSRELAAAVDQRFRGMAKANEKSKTAMLQYVDKAGQAAAADTEKQVKAVNGRFDKVLAALRGVNTKAMNALKDADEAKKGVEEAKKAVKKNADHIAELEQGIVPDFETARKAVDEVNKFNEGIAGILGFDPLNALKQSRQEAD